MLFKMNPSIFIVAVVGPDGVGKTTSINECKNKLIENNYSFISKHHVWGDLDERPMNHDSTRNLYFRPLKYTGRNNIIIKGYNFIISNLNQIYAEVKYVIRLDRMILEAAKRHDVILIDRYIFDKIAAKESRNIFDIQYYLRKILLIFTFKPNLCLMLSNTPLEIHNRKGELSINEAKLYLKSIKKIAKNNSLYFNEIITNKSPKVIGNDMYNAINYFNTDNKFFKKKSAEKINLNEFFNLLKDIPFVVLKNETPYAVNSFPDKYPHGKDLDILVTKKDFKNIISIIKKESKKYKDIFSVNFIKDNDYKSKIRFLEGNKLHYQIDVSFIIEFCDNNFTNKIIESKLKSRNYFIPTKQYELWIRIIEYKLNNKKTHHLDYIIKNKNLINFSLIENKELKDYTHKLLNEII